MLHAGGYRPGNQPGTFVCNQNCCKGSCSVSPRRLSNSSETEQARPPSSVLLAPLKAPVEPVGPSPPSKSWTASAEKTQSARQRFFQAEVTTGDRTPAKLSKEGGKTAGKTLAEENRNNNNKRPFTVRPAERRWVSSGFLQFRHPADNEADSSAGLEVTQFSPTGPVQEMATTSQPRPDAGWETHPIRNVQEKPTKPARDRQPYAQTPKAIHFSCSPSFFLTPCQHAAPTSPNCLRLSAFTGNKAFLSLLAHLRSPCI